MAQVIWMCYRCGWRNVNHWLHCTGCLIRQKQQRRPLVMRHVGEIMDWLREAGLTV